MIWDPHLILKRNRVCQLKSTSFLKFVYFSRRIGLRFDKGRGIPHLQRKHFNKNSYAECVHASTLLLTCHND